MEIKMSTERAEYNKIKDLFWVRVVVHITSIL